MVDRRLAGLGGIAFVGVGAGLVLAAAVGPLVWGPDPLAIDLGETLLPPSRSHPMGTDALGRDVLARFLAGARISLLIGAVVVVVGTIVGGAIGIASGLMRGRTDSLLMRLMDSILAFPPLLLAMTVAIGLGAGLVSATIGITLTMVPYYARLVRSDVLRVRSLDFVEAARAMGGGNIRIVVRHIVPHTTTTVLTQSAAVFSGAILAVAGLSFVGLGAQIPTPEWGIMITDGLRQALLGDWWIALFPGLGILLAVTIANVGADYLRNILDPRHEGGF